MKKSKTDRPASKEAGRFFCLRQNGKNGYSEGKMKRMSKNRMEIRLRFVIISSHFHDFMLRSICC
ncbi:MAG: hypothetical protein MJ118_03965, partial [Clostridia bacterium]|nr:hypothetical protein [Clostridia bacterium]